MTNGRCAMFPFKRHSACACAASDAIMWQQPRLCMTNASNRQQCCHTNFWNLGKKQQLEQHGECLPHVQLYTLGSTASNKRGSVPAAQLEQSWHSVSADQHLIYISHEQVYTLPTCRHQPQAIRGPDSSSRLWSNSSSSFSGHDRPGEKWCSAAELRW